jgi:outer membrane immunogenic protein
MKRYLIAAAAIVIASFGSSAQATDLPPMATPAARAPAQPIVQTWHGPLAGVSLGARWGDITGTTISFGAGGPPFPALAVQDYDSATFRVGGYLGHDWHINPRWLVGIEGDFAWGDGSKRVEALQGIGNVGNFSEFRHTWDFGVRGRVGYLMDPTLLIYLTGGIQWQHVEATVNCGVATCGASTYAQTNETTRTGWTLGGGLEKMLAGRWLVRGEYRYADYGTWRTTFGTVPAVVIVKDFEIVTHTAFFGVGKKF